MLHCDVTTHDSMSLRSFQHHNAWDVMLLMLDIPFHLPTVRNHTTVSWTKRLKQKRKLALIIAANTSFLFCLLLTHTFFFLLKRHNAHFINAAAMNTIKIISSVLDGWDRYFSLCGRWKIARLDGNKVIRITFHHVGNRFLFYPQLNVVARVLLSVAWCWSNDITIQNCFPFLFLYKLL